MSGLVVEGVCAGYGPAQVLHDLSLTVASGEAVAILGPNGAGKSTLMNVVSGVHPARSGSVHLDELSVLGLASHRVVRAGLVHVPEGHQVFPEMTVEENLQLGAFAAPDRDGSRLEGVLAIFPRLRERLRQQSQTLSGGEQQMLAIGRGMMGDPSFLLLDEPTLGLAPILVGEIVEKLREIRETTGVTILVSEQNAYLASALCDRSYVLINGVVVDHLDHIPEDMSELMAVYTGASTERSTHHNNQEQRP